MFDETQSLIEIIKLSAVVIVAVIAFILILWYIITKRPSKSSLNNVMLCNDMNRYQTMLSAQAHQNYLNDLAEQRNIALIDNANANNQALLNQQYRTQDLMQKAAFDAKLDRFEHNFNSAFNTFNSFMS